MYVPLLIRKYLAKRRIAWAALVAVALCTAMVLVVLSVMSGWLGMFKASFEGLTGDVIVRSSRLSGFAGYEELARRLEALPEVDAAVPMIQTYGLIDIQRGAVTDAVDVVGWPMDRVGEINRFPESLYLAHQFFDDLADGTARLDLPAQIYLDVLRERGGLTPEQDAALAKAVAEEPLGDAERAALRSLKSGPRLDLPLPPETYRYFQEQASGGFRSRVDVAGFPGLIAGTKVVFNPAADGSLQRGAGLEDAPVKLQVLPQRAEAVEVRDAEIPDARRFWVVDDALTGVHARDSKTVYLPFDTLQEMAEMDGGEAYVDLATGEEVVEPARTSQLHVALAAGVAMPDGRDAVQRVVDEMLAEDPEKLLPDVAGGGRSRMIVSSWEEVTGGLIAQVEKETVLVTFLMGMISLVAVVLIFCIFYMIVVEKTRDIGILKAVGATGRGVAAIFLGYGAAIGLVGGLAGLLLGCLVVWNINHIHDALTVVLGVQVYNPQFYLFDKIPNTVEAGDAVGILIVAIVASVLGSVLPAARAARLRPVEALRFE